MPFRAGEKLAFRVLWSKFSVNAGNLGLSVVERRNFFGRMAWHFQATAHSMDTMRILYALDDQFDSYTDAATLESRRYEMYLNELGKKENKVVHMLPTGEVSRAPSPSVAVLPGTRDPLGAFYILRSYPLGFLMFFAHSSQRFIINPHLRLLLFAAAHEHSFDFIVCPNVGPRGQWISTSVARSRRAIKAQVLEHHSVPIGLRRWSIFNGCVTHIGDHRKFRPAEINSAQP